jgi:SHS2 domain-containing protein
MNGYKELEHTADIGLQVWGEDLPELFFQAAGGYYAQALVHAPRPGQNWQSFTLEEDTLEDLLVAFLGELNYHLMVKSEYFYPLDSIQVLPINDGYRIAFRGKRGTLKKSNNQLNMEIKAVTYHQLKIRKENGHYSTKIIFDL